jgi:hypothetical protein
MPRPFTRWSRSENWTQRLLKLRGRILIASGHLRGDEFLKFAGRVDLWQAQRRALSAASLRR